MKKYDLYTVKKILSFMKNKVHYLVFALLCAIVSVLSSLYVTVLTGNAIDFMISQGNVDFEKIIFTITKILIMVALSSSMQWIMNLFTNSVAFSTINEIRNAAFSNIQHVPVGFIDSTGNGDITNRMTADAEFISDGLIMGFTQLFQGIVTIISTLVFMLTIDFKITLIVVVATPVSLLVASFIAKSTFNMFKKQTEIRGDMSSFIEEMITNQKVVDAFGYEKKSIERFAKINEELKKTSIKATFFSSLTNPSTRFVNGLVYTSVGVIGALSAINGNMSIGNLSCFLSYANQYMKPFNEISGVFAELQSAFACARRVFEIIDAKKEIECDNNVLPEHIKGDVNIENVYFSYNKETKLIENFNLDVKSGQKIAIVGPTGCGKTTLINLLMRFYDVDCGKILLDGTDITSVTRDNMRSSYAMVLQETWLKTGTIKENISYGTKNATDDMIISAAKKAYAHSFIERLPDGYDTIISDDTTNISQGQKQLLCIARAMISTPSILILDEATSNIDTRTEKLIQNAFNTMMQGRTSFVVAHRLSTIKNADTIIVMRDGKIIETGNHESLLKDKGAYFSLYNSQFAH